jgi:hypothetical protein
MRRRAVSLSLTILLAGACGGTGGKLASKCDRLWVELDAARDAARTYMPYDPPSAEQERLHAKVARTHVRWLTAGCEQP